MGCTGAYDSVRGCATSIAAPSLVAAGIDPNSRMGDGGKSAVGDGVDDGDGISSFVMPTSFRGQLKDYQKKGVKWLLDLYDQGINGILAGTVDDIFLCVVI